MKIFKMDSNVMNMKRLFTMIKIKLSFTHTNIKGQIIAFIILLKSNKNKSELLFSILGNLTKVYVKNLIKSYSKHVIDG